MNKEELREKVATLLPSATFDEATQWPTVTIDPPQWEAFAKALKETLDFDYLFCVTAVDWRTHITMVYHLTSTIHRHTLIIKANLDHDQPTIRTVADIWRTAEFHEREAFDLFGVVFTEHPDLRRLFMTDECKGWPLRKDYEDPVNMIKL
jgi:NADH:ubiquinone oxidoreductase subunit C